MDSRSSFILDLQTFNYVFIRANLNIKAGSYTSMLILGHFTVIIISVMVVITG